MEKINGLFIAGADGFIQKPCKLVYDENGLEKVKYFDHKANFLIEGHSKIFSNSGLIGLRSICLGSLGKSL